MARNESESYLNLLEYKIIYFTDKNGEVYQVDPSNPDQAQAPEDVEVRTIPYQFDKRNLYGYDKDYIMGLLLLNFFAGFTYWFALPIRLIITPFLILYFFVPPFQMLNDINKVYWTIDSFWFDVIAGWLTTNLEVYLVQWFFDLLTYVSLLYVVGIFYVGTSNIDYLTTISVVGGLYILQIFIGGLTTLFGYVEMENLYPAADDGQYY